MAPRRIDAPEMAALLEVGLTEGEARDLERQLSKVARAYGRAQVRVRKLKAQLRAAERLVTDTRREMRLLISSRRVR